MDTSRLEELWDQWIEKQDDLINRIENLESTIEQHLEEANRGISLLHDEMNWWGKEHSFAKQILSGLSGIETALSAVGNSCHPQMNNWVQLAGCLGAFS